ncbi:MAG: Uncharacterised protein [Synechococcus sp. MIT S9220]|nr:MAG: Uncharacterised protein [Synechococcus sp. MIT S9220]
MYDTSPPGQRVRSFNIDEALDTELRVFAAKRGVSCTVVIKEALAGLLKSQAVTA